MLRSVPVVMAALAVSLVLKTPTTAAQTLPQTNAASLYQQPTLDGTSLAFAYDRLTGITPDFRPYAERSAPTRTANAFDSEAVLAREIARFQAAFQNFDLGKVYTLRMNAEIQQYSAARGGYALPLAEDSFIPILDSGSAKQYGVKFSNTDEVNFIPVGDATAARAFAARTNLNTQGSYVGSGVLQMAFRLVSAPPALDGGPPMVQANILAARVMSRTGTVIYDFGLTPTARRPAVSAEASGPTVLKAADVQGLRLGMPQAEADAIGSRGWTTKLGSQQAGQTLWFNDLQAHKGEWAVCGKLTNSAPDPMDYMVDAPPPAFKDCISYGFAHVGASNGPFGTLVSEISAQQFLTSNNVTSIRSTLEDKYGKPTIVRNGGGDLVWIGRDPTRPDDAPVKIEAMMGQENGASAQNRLVLQMSIVSYVDPTKPTVVAQPTVTGGPKL